MPKVLVTFAFCGLAVAFACGDTSGPRAGLNVVSGAGVSDTVLSTFKPPLTVQLLDGDRQPMSGQTVYFNTNGFVLAAPIDDDGSGIGSGERAGVHRHRVGQRRAEGAHRRTI